VLETKENNREFATLGALHRVEMNITEAIHALRLDMHKCIAEPSNVATESLKAATTAVNETTRAHKRIDDLHRLWLVVLLGWLATALGAAWGFWRILTQK